MKQLYEKWAAQKLKDKPPCKVVHTIFCSPLRNDPVCMACFEADMRKNEKEADGHVD